jgi:hypothetical protein
MFVVGVAIVQRRAELLEAKDRLPWTRRSPCGLISPQGRGVGLNLPAAEHVFLFDPWWNPAIELQGMTRSSSGISAAPRLAPAICVRPHPQAPRAPP